MIGGMLQNFKNLQRGSLNGSHFIKRWPTAPKIIFFGPPNTYKDELSQR